MSCKECPCHPPDPKEDEMGAMCVRCKTLVPLSDQKVIKSVRNGEVYLYALHTACWDKLTKR